MRKVSWLAMGCVAAYVAQAIIAADTTGIPTAKDPASGRSRLLIFSRSKDKSKKLTDAAAPKSDAGRTRTSKLAADSAVDEDTLSASAETPVRTTLPARTALPARRVVPNVSKPVATASTATTEDLAPSQDDDELIRKLFEEDEFDPQSAKTTKSRTAPRAASAARKSAEELDLASESASTKPAAKAAPKVDRNSLLLDSVDTQQVSTNKRATSRPSPAAKPTIKRVANEDAGKLDLEVNPFEADEQPAKVINARFDSDANDKSKTAVKQVGAYATQTLNVKAKPGNTAAKSLVPVKKAEPVKGGAKTVAGHPVKSEEDVPANIDSPSTLGTNHSPQVDVSWEAKGEIALGQECQCSLIVQNSSKIPCRDLVVEASFPESVHLIDANPFPKGASAKLEWQFAHLAAGEKKVIELKMVPTKAGELAASAQVRFTGTASTSFNVSEPKLTTVIKLASEVRIGDPASATVTVSNPGTGTAQNVVLKANLPAGLECKSGQEFVSEIGPLGAGESRVVRLGLIAVSGGDHALKVVAHSTTAELETSAQASIRVLAPSLALTASGPSLRYLNRAAKYNLTATNNSNAATDNVRISQVVDRGFDYIKADHGGRWDAQRRTVSWYVGHMDPGQSVSVELDLMPKETGEFRQQFRVTGDAGIEATSVVATRVDGAASLVMSVKDAEDPIEVGGEMIYTINVRNEGSKSAAKVAIACELPPDVELVSADGPTAHIVESGMLIFKPVAEIAPSDSISYKLKVKSLAAGTMKLRARLTSESIQKPLIVEEATQFYGE